MAQKLVAFIGDVQATRMAFKSATPRSASSSLIASVTEDCEIDSDCALPRPNPSALRPRNNEAVSRERHHSTVEHHAQKSMSPRRRDGNRFRPVYTQERSSRLHIEGQLVTAKQPITLCGRRLPAPPVGHRARTSAPDHTVRINKAELSASPELQLNGKT